MKDCSKGKVWCPIQKKCITNKEMAKMKIKMSKGGGMKKIKEAHNLVDDILDGNYSVYKASKKADKILDEIENNIDTVPDQNLDELLDDIKDEIAEDSYNEDEDEDDDYECEETTIEENMRNSVKLLVTENAYREYFKKMLKKWNVKSPSELNTAKKKEFFNQVDKGWKGKKEKK